MSLLDLLSFEMPELVKAGPVHLPARLPGTASAEVKRRRRRRDDGGV
jgi:hypothetical protein